MTHITGHEDAGDAGFKIEGIAIDSPTCRALALKHQVLTGNHITLRVAFDDMAASRLDGAVIEYDADEDGYLLDHPDAVTAVWCG